MAVKFYVGVVAILAAATGVFAGHYVPTTQHPSVAAIVVLALLIAVAEYSQIRYNHHRQIDAFNIVEGVLAPLVFIASGAVVAVVTAVAVLAGNVVRRNHPLKTLFNCGQWTLAATTASLVLHGIRTSSATANAGLAALLVAVLTMSVINQTAIAGVLAISAPRGRDDAPRSTAAAMTGHVVSILASLVLGVVLTGAYLWSAWTLPAGAVILLGMHAAGRANAALYTDTARLTALQRATHTLAAAIDAESGIPTFLTETRLGFEVQVAELVLFSERGATVHSCTAASDDAYTVSIRQHQLAEAVASRLGEPTRFTTGDGSDAGAVLASTDHNSVIAAPLRSGGTTIGVLFLFDRIGMEGFETGELKIADALAREFVGFLERVTLLQAIDEERRKLADILGNTSDGIFSMEADGTITSWNAGLATMTGYDAEEVVGTRHFGLLRPRDANGRDLYVERWADLIDTPSGLPADVQIVAQSGQSVWLSCSYSRIPAKDSGRDVLVVVARNITQARELERLKDDFVAVVSHELRTPLVPIKGWAQTLLNRGDRLNDDQRRTAVQSILAQAQKLESLVLNILEASRIEAGRMDGDGVADVGGITARIVEDTLASRPDRTLRLRPPSVPCNVKGSSVWVERSVANLIANAIKYSPDDEPVDVVISTEGDDVVVAVTDRGPGIAADAQERIFERFERLEETRKQTGTGLGLYITRRLARAMGGDVSVSSVPGAGSTFLLRLPVAPVSVGATTRLPDQRVTEVAEVAEREEPSNVVRLH